jgi:single-strand DNA-binding protein
MEAWDYDKTIKRKGDEKMINQVTLVGRLTRDPELKVTTEGTSVAHITLAVNRHYRNQHGEVDADFVQCTLWRKAADNTSQYCRKGSVVGITGRLQTRNYENKEGKRVYVTEVVAETVRFLSAKPHDVISEQRKEETTIGV